MFRFNCALMVDDETVDVCLSHKTGLKINCKQNILADSCHSVCFCLCFVASKLPCCNRVTSFPDNEGKECRRFSFCHSPHLPNTLNKEIFFMCVDILNTALLAGSCCSHLLLTKKSLVTVDVRICQRFTVKMQFLSFLLLFGSV